jgi:hypothetical protein
MPRGLWPAGLPAGQLDAEPGYALRASAGPARTQAGPAAPAGGPQPGQPGAIGQQLGYAARTRDRDDRPDPATGQRQPLPRSARHRIVRHAAHDLIVSVPDARRLEVRMSDRWQLSALPSGKRQDIFYRTPAPPGQG